MKRYRCAHCATGVWSFHSCIEGQQTTREQAEKEDKRLSVESSLKIAVEALTDIGANFGLCPDHVGEEYEAVRKMVWDLRVCARDALAKIKGDG